MRKSTILPRAAAMTVLCLLCFPGMVWANSSWRWISELRPFDILPFVVAATLLIEILAINYIPGLRRLGKVALVVGLANLLSFLLPYGLYLNNEMGYTLMQVLDHLPVYIVGLGYLLLTLAAEVPVVYFALRKNAPRRKVLLGTVVGANVLTTALVALVERLICYGVW